jgi:hypothetical protein
MARLDLERDCDVLPRELDRYTADGSGLRLQLGVAQERDAGVRAERLVQGRVAEVTERDQRLAKLLASRALEGQRFVDLRARDQSGVH